MLLLIKFSYLYENITNILENRTICLKRMKFLLTFFVYKQTVIWSNAVSFSGNVTKNIKDKILQSELIKFKWTNK